MRNLLNIIFICAFSIATAQVGINTSAPDPSAMLDVQSDNSGMLTPRLTTAQKAAIASPATGLLVYDTDLNAFSYYNGSSWMNLGSASNANDYTGWGDYADTQFTTASAGFVAANTLYYLPNNGGITNESQKPIDVSTFYNPLTGRILGRNGDGLNITIEFRLRPLTNNDTRVTLGVDIGGSVGEIYTRDFVLTRGLNEEHYYLSSFNAYTLGTWQANGGRVLIRATDNIEIYGIRYVLTRTHKAR
jgi:hypothetical protein